MKVEERYSFNSFLLCISKKYIKNLRDKKVYLYKLETLTYFGMEAIHLSFYSNFRPFWDRYQDELRDVLLLMRKLLSTKVKESTAILPLFQRRELILNQDICSHLKSIAIERVYYFSSFFHQNTIFYITIAMLDNSRTRIFQSK